MTRLVAEDIDGLGVSLPAYDAYLHRLTGTGLAGIAAHAQAEGPRSEAYRQSMRRTMVGIVPVNYGQGVIPGFAEALRDIAAFLGATAFITQQANILGMAEAVERGATMLLLSDDDDFMALNIKGNRASHNSEATGRGFVSALALMAGGMQGRDVLVVGAGPVGQAAASWVIDLGGRCWVFDQLPEASRRLAGLVNGVRVADELAAALALCDLVIEATPVAGVLQKAWLRPQHRIAAPGVPLGVEVEPEDGLHAWASRFIVHDRLEIGVATMLFSALAV